MRYPDKKTFIYDFIKGSKHYFIEAIICILLASLFDLINPKIISFTIDSIIGNKPSNYVFINNQMISYIRNHLVVIALLILLFALLGAFFRYFFNVFNAKGSETFVEKTRNKLFYHIEHLPFSWQSENDTGDIIQRCTNDVEMIKNFLSEQLTGMFRIMIMLSLSLIFMLQINLVLTLIAFVFVPIIVFYSLFFYKKIHATFEIADGEEGNLSSICQENLTGVRVVRAFGKEKEERERFEKQNDIYTNSYMKLSTILSAFWSTGDGISGLQVMLITLVGAVFCVRGIISTGNYIAFISYNSMLVWPIRRLGRVISEMGRAGVSIDRLRYIMNSEIEEVSQSFKPNLYQDIIFEDVSFSYTDNSPEIISHLNLHIKAGEKLGILGGTGSGKSTLMYLLDKLFTVSKGNIYIGDYNINDIDTYYLRENIGMVLQEPYLFSRTIKENISIAKETNEEAIIKSSNIAALDEAIHHFKHGYDTYVGERGVTLSGGQKQRTAIAQMIVRQTPIMIFDDSLSAVDSETDAKIRHALNDNIKDSTLIFISHRIQTLMNCDHIIVLNKGKIIEEGNHQSLYNLKGTYYEICQVQNKGEVNEQEI